MYIFVLFQYNVNFEVSVLIPFFFFFSFYEMAGIDKDIEGERSTTSKQH